MASFSTPLKRKREDAIVSGSKMELGSPSKKTWSKDEELAILSGIVEYEKETKLSYNEDWDALYDFIKGSLNSEFSKSQLRDKIRRLKNKYTASSLDDHEMLELSSLIWSESPTETACAVEHELVTQETGQAKEVPSAEHEKVTEQMDQSKDDDGEKEKKSEEDGLDEFCVLQDAFEALVFPNISKYQQKLLIHNLRKLRAEKIKELSDEWKALLAMKHRMEIEKLSFAAKLAVALE